MARRLSYRAGAAVGVASFATTSVVSLVSAVVVARIYGVQEIGLWALAVAPAAVVAVLSSFRERPALIREIATLPPRSPRITALSGAVFALSVLVTVVVAGLGLLAAVRLYEGPLDHPEVVGDAALAMAGYVVLTNTSFMADTVLAAFRAATALYWIRLHQALMTLALSIALGVLVAPDATSLVLAGIGGYATALVHRCLALRSFLTLRVSRAEWRRGAAALPPIVRFGLKIAPGGFADGLANETATWTLAAMGTVAQVGALNRATLLQRRLGDLSFRVNEMLFPTLVERRGEGDGRGFDRALVDSLRYAAAFLLLPAAAVGGAA
jgi:O-antigen/teichoic acid export membrane protein